MTGYSTKQVGEAVGISPRQVRSFVHAGLLTPRRGRGGHFRFSFRDIVLLRAAVELRRARISTRRIRGALEQLREQLPRGRPLSSVVLGVVGDRVVIRDQGTSWDAETGQTTIDFRVGDLAARVEPFIPRDLADASDTADLDADGWFDLGVDLEALSVDRAAASYRRALNVQPDHADAHVNLGRLAHEAGRLEEAERHYRRAVGVRPEHPLAWYNLGVTMDEAGRAARARELYERAIELDPALAVAHFNLARLLEREGEVREALSHLSSYKRLTRTS